MANVLAELFQNTANAIREKTGDTGTMKPAEFPEKIRKITADSTSEETPAPYTLLENPTGLPEGCMLNNFTWHPNGQHMIFITTKGAVLYDITTEPYTYIGLIENSNLSVPWSAVYSSDGTKLILVCGGLDTTEITIRTYDTTVIPYVPIEGVIPSAYTKSSYFGQGRWSALHPNGEILCITGESGYVVFDTTTMPYTVLYEQTGVGQASNAIFHPDGTKLYVVGTSSLYTNPYSVKYYVVLLKIAEDKTITFTIDTTETGLPTREETNYIMFSGDKILTTGMIGGKISMYAAGSTTAVLSVNLPARSGEYCCPHPNGKYLISVGPSYKGCRVSELSEHYYRNHQLTPEYALSSRCIGCSPDRKRLFIGSSDSTQPLFIYHLPE